LVGRLWRARALAWKERLLLETGDAAFNVHVTSHVVPVCVKGKVADHDVDVSVKLSNGVGRLAVLGGAKPPGQASSIRIQTSNVDFNVLQVKNNKTMYDGVM